VSPDDQVDDAQLVRLAGQLGDRARFHAARLCTAESLTGGLIAATLTSVAGSSDWFEAGFVTYTLAAKQRVLGVRADTLARHGAVSEPTAREMALGALEAADATHAVAVTGVAGPAGGDPRDPVGTVWLAWAVRGEPLVRTARISVDGDRAAVRTATVHTALQGLLALLR
jgi:nicotinamide-nucleotide amidase